MLRVAEPRVVVEYRRRESFARSLTGLLHRLLRTDIPDGWVKLEIRATYPEAPNGPNGEMRAPGRFIEFRADLDRDRGHFCRGGWGPL